MHRKCWFKHQWAGCVCARCGQARDQDHDWTVVECRRQCRRCGLVQGIHHDWHGCRCRSCGAENHLWQEGVCALCGERCQHPEVAGTWESQFFHRNGRAPQVCQRCGQQMGADWSGPPQTQERRDI